MLLYYYLNSINLIEDEGSDCNYYVNLDNRFTRCTVWREVRTCFSHVQSVSNNKWFYTVQEINSNVESRSYRNIAFWKKLDSNQEISLELRKYNLCKYFYPNYINPVTLKYFSFYHFMRLSRLDRIRASPPSSITTFNYVRKDNTIWNFH